MNNPKHKQALRDGIVELSRRDRLSDAELARLRQLSADASSHTPSAAPANPSRRRWLAAAASVGVIGIAGYFGGVSFRGAGNLEQMAAEVAGNHLRAAPLDVFTSDLDQAREAFASLGFHLLDAAAVENVPGRLMGGRFCSIASVPAALLRYQDGARINTVYQALYDPSKHRGAADMDSGQPGAVRHVGGVEVCICHTQGVLLAVASGGSRTYA